MKTVRIGLLLLAGAALAGLAAVLLRLIPAAVPASAALRAQGVLIDPGHGGFDVGAIGANGSEEDKLNLSVALALQEALAERDIPAVLTRTGHDALGQSKEEDMQARADMIKTSSAAVLVSIHMNSFPDDPTVFGPQVFYQRSSSVGEGFASALQPFLNDCSGGSRKPAAQGLMVLRAAEGVLPGVLVECGFISNPEEEEKLNDPAYQKKLAQAIAEGIAGYCGE